MTIDSRLPNFRALTPAQRLEHIARIANLTEEEAALVSNPGALSVDRANGMVENVIGTFELPFGIGGNFQIN
jgi:hydroxymethylglutaryl-CoA reductase